MYAAAKSLQSCLTLCGPITAAEQPNKNNKEKGYMNVKN